MHAPENAYRTIIRSTAIIGSSTVVGLLVALVRTKVLAMLLGAAGIGLMGLFQNILHVASTLFGFGISGSAVRQLAAASDDPQRLRVVRQSLWWGSLVLAFLGAAGVWLVRDFLAGKVLGDQRLAREAGWIAVAVFASIMYGSQHAVLRSMRRVSDVARVNVTGALAGAAVSVLVIWEMGMAGVVWYVLAAPAFSMLIASYYTHITSDLKKGAADAREVIANIQPMLTLGFSFMVVELIKYVTILGIRSHLLITQGLEMTGYFEASWNISMNYLGILMTAMTADYYPHLVSHINDKPKTAEIVHRQTEVTVLLGIPAILAFIAFASPVITVIYSSSFSPVSDVLRWQMLGNLFRIAAWPMAFIVIARGDWRSHLLVQALWFVLFGLGVLSFQQQYGLLVSGVMFLLCSIIFYLVVSRIVLRTSGYTASRSVRLNILLSFGAGAMIIGIGSYSATLSMAAGGICTIWLGRRCWRELGLVQMVRERLLR